MSLEPSHCKTSLLFSLLQAMTQTLIAFAAPLFLLALLFSQPENSGTFCNITNARLSQPLTTPRYLCFSRQLQMIPSLHFYHQMLLGKHIALHLMAQDRFFNECQNYQSFARKKTKNKNKTKHNIKSLKVQLLFIKSKQVSDNSESCNSNRSNYRGWFCQLTRTCLLFLYAKNHELLCLEDRLNLYLDKPVGLLPVIAVEVI